MARKAKIVETKPQQHQPEIPVIHVERNPVDTRIVAKSTMLLGLKYLIWGLLVLITYFTGFARYIGDWAISLAYPSEFLTWTGFGFMFFILVSALTFPIDYCREFVLATKGGSHSMPWVSTLGRWVRRTFLDASFWGLLNWFIMKMYFSIASPGKQGPQGGSAPNWWINALLWGLLLVPAWFEIRDFLLLVFSNAIKQIPKGQDRDRLRQLGKALRITILDVFYYDLGGDYNAESKLFGLFGVYFLFVPAKLAGKDALYASAAKGIARAKVLRGTVLNIIRWIAYALCIILLWVGYNWAYVNPVFTWYSEQTKVGDPALFIMVFLVFGAVFLAATPLVNYFAKNMDIGADKLANKVIGKPDAYDHYLELVDSGKGVSGKRDTWTEIGLFDTFSADKVKELINK